MSRKQLPTQVRDGCANFFLLKGLLISRKKSSYSSIISPHFISVALDVLCLYNVPLHLLCPDVGSRLLGFLDFYGNNFDPRSCGISLRRRCYFNRTSSDTSFFPPQFDPLYIEDPLQPGNNVGRNCFRIYLIQRIWSDALRALTSTLDQDDLRGRSLLDAIITEGPSRTEPTPNTVTCEVE